ncbi:MAG: LOG family protein [Alphaproteobacteria bacterium]|nr:LOG family protein [Alphaproteobacteria bacterium]
MSNFKPEKAYKNLGFLNAPPARPIRILCEYEEPRQRFSQQGVHDTIVFFGSARARPPEVAATLLADAQAKVAAAPDDAAAARELARATAAHKLARYYDEARELSRRLTEWAQYRDGKRHYVVATGGGPGIMEAANRGAADVENGRSVGLGISLPFEPGVNEYVTRELAFEFHYFFTRKLWFVYLMKACVVFPGGFGTMDELFESLTLIQTGKVTKEVPIVLFGTAYWDKVLDLDAMVEAGVIAPTDKLLVHRTDDVDEAFRYLTAELDRIEHHHRKVSG